LSRPRPREAAAHETHRWSAASTAANGAPEIKRDEATALAALVAGLEWPHPWPDTLPPVLERLFQPAQQALAAIGVREQTHRGVLRILAREMHRRQRTYWSWTTAEWTETLTPSIRQFRPYHRAQGQTRLPLLALSYLLCETWNAPVQFQRLALARRVLGRTRVDRAVAQVRGVLVGWGYQRASLGRVSEALGQALLAQRSSELQTIPPTLLEELRTGRVRHLREAYYPLSQALAALGVPGHPLPFASPRRAQSAAAMASEVLDGVAPEWLSWCRRWRLTSTLRPHTRLAYYGALLRAGRWLKETHPKVTSPEHWSRDLAAEYVSVVDRLMAGQWLDTSPIGTHQTGKPLSAGAKEHQIMALRAFFRDCQEWGWIPRRFDPRRSFAVPRSIRDLRVPNPRVIADDVWAKLLWAGLNLSETDLPLGGQGRPYYPLVMVRALAITWLFAGLRGDEIRRLRVGCVRWSTPASGSTLPTPSEDTICLLEVPPNKTGPVYTKPVDRIVGDSIVAWERVRPSQPARLDPKTGESLQYLFAYRGRRIGLDSLNKMVIPLLCRKAGVPDRDARGAITSHRARATIASQLFNAKEPMSLFELQAWLGHRTPAATQHYAKLTPTKLAKAYTAADYFTRNVRTVEVLIDREAVQTGVAADQPWRFYDLGHGYCSYDFFEQCPHRMACAKCAFYVPKGSGRAQMLEGKAHLLRMLQEIPLTDDERAAAEDGVNAFDQLLAKLTDVPTPAGPTPRQLAAEGPTDGGPH
jgi:hypothetical protein